MVTETITVSRGKTDVMSVRSNTDHTIQAVFTWSYGARAHFRPNMDRRESATVVAQLMVQRGTDLQARDRIKRSNGETYIVVGHQLWDQVNPISGMDYKWMIFELESGNG